MLDSLFCYIILFYWLDLQHSSTGLLDALIWYSLKLILIILSRWWHTLSQQTVLRTLPDALTEPLRSWVCYSRLVQTHAFLLVSMGTAHFVLPFTCEIIQNNILKSFLFNLNHWYPCSERLLGGIYQQRAYKRAYNRKRLDYADWLASRLAEHTRSGSAECCTARYTHTFLAAFPGRARSDAADLTTSSVARPASSDSYVACFRANLAASPNFPFR